VGAEPGLAPEPATDDELLAVHSAAYIAAVRRFGADPSLAPAFGIESMGDVPPFPGMHEASAAVAGGSLGAMAAILRGDVEHAYHPGGGLHHAMPARASGFCVYDDPALAISSARRAGLRVLYVDLDVHHGDGVEAIHRDDPGVMTVSFHESGRYLFPGTGFADEIGDGVAAGTVVNVPFEPLSGEGAWPAAVRTLVPSLAAAFGPDLIVSQHGADSHAWDPLAHLRVTTTAMGEAARLVDSVAHRFAGGRWLATGGGGYEVYRVVPRAWALTWLAGAHRDVPDTVPAAWRERWAPEAARWDAGPLPERFKDPPNAGYPLRADQRAAEAESLKTVAKIRGLVVPRLLVVAEDRGWWDSRTDGAADHPAAVEGAWVAPVVTRLEADALRGLRLVPRTTPPADPGRSMDLLIRAVGAGARLIGAMAGDLLVGVALVAPAAVGVPESATATVPAAGAGPAEDELIALGVAPGWRRRGLASALVAAVAEDVRDRGVGLVARIGAGERDIVEPLPLATRLEIASRLMARAGCRPTSARSDAPIGASVVYRRT
jgi:acetoin utilization protein AcuC